MAQFYQEPNPINADYSKDSKAPSRVEADTSLGTLFSGIGQVGNDAGKALSTIFDTNIKKDAQDIINPIRNDAGAGLSQATVQDIAGSGAKGKVRALQMRQGVGNVDDPSAPLGFAATQPLTSDTIFGPMINSGPGAGQPQPPKELPPDAQQEVTQLSRMQQAYRSGQLSDSSYSAQLIAGAKQLKARYPGFEDEVDAAFSNITGQQSANAIRKSLETDIQYNQAAMLSASSADDKFREKYRGEAAALGFDPDKADLSVMRPAVNKYLGQQQILKGQQQEAAVGSPQAEQTLSDTIALQSRTSLGALATKAQGQMGLQDYVAKAKQLSINGGSPGEIDELANQMQFGMQQSMLAARQQAYAPIEGRHDGHTAVSLQGPGGDVKLQAALDAQYKPWSDAIALVKSGNFSALQRSTDTLKYQDNLDLQNLYRAFPAARAGSAINRAFPQNPLAVNRFSESILTGWQAAISNGLGNAILNGTTATPAPTPSQAIGAYGPTVLTPKTDTEKVVAAQAARDVVKQYNQVISPENKNYANSTHVAKQFFGDFQFFDNMSDNARTQLLMTMASPEKSKFIKTLAANDPDVEGAYTNWAKHAAASIWRSNSDTLQSYLTDKSFDIQFNPKSNQFEDHTKYAAPGSTTGGPQPQRITNMLQSVNNAMTVMKPIVGDNPESLLNAMGIDPHAAKQDGLVKRMFNALGDKLNDWSKSGHVDDVVSGAIALEPQQTRGVIKGNVSDSTDTGVDHFAIPPGMSPQEFIAELKKRHQL